MPTEDKIRQEFLSVVRSTQALLSSMTADERSRELRGASANDYIEGTARRYITIAYGKTDALRSCIGET